MEKIIYLDWNVFQDIFQERNNKYDIERLKIILEDLRDSRDYKLVYSSAHMEDLSKCKSEENIKKDLHLLSYFTKNNCLTIDGNIIEIKPEVVLNEVREKLKNDVKKIKNMDIMFSFKPVSIDVSKFPEDSIFLKFLEDGHILSLRSMYKFFEYIKNEIPHNHSIQKQFRKLIKICAENNNAENNNFLKGRIFLEYLLSTKEEIKSNFIDIFDSFLSISNKSIKSIGLEEKIIISYQLLDFFPAFSEKLDRRNNQNNIRLDSNHLFFASNSKCLICNDKKMLEKAEIIYTSFGIKTKLLSPINFLRSPETVI